MSEIEYSIKKIEAMLAQDYMTTPVREILTDVLANLKLAAAQHGG